MGGIWMASADLLDSLIEIVGFKTGLVLSKERAVLFLAEQDPDFAAKLAGDNRMMRTESAVYEELVAHLLYRLGSLSSPRVSGPVGDVYHKYKKDPEAAELVPKVGELFVEFMEAFANRDPSEGPADPTPFFNAAKDKFGLLGAIIAMDYIKGVQRYMHRTPWGAMRRTEWKDTRELEELFKSEKLETMYGSFFDQRFIDFLAANFAEVDDIHWRQFEGATAEHFARQGFDVNLGPGRNDDGLDLRIFPKDGDQNLPPLIIVQCKRERRKLGKVLVKSVYADVLHHNATSGLIVTTSELAPGAEALRLARGYPVDVIDRGKVELWIKGMRTEPL